jgi:predicted histone-like DNA-binding protein
MSKIIYDIYRNVKVGSVSEGRYFGRILQTETLNTAKLAMHIAEHGSPYTRDIVEGVLRKAESCILELILDSKKIKIDGLGTFYITGENQKHGTISIDRFNPKTSFKGLHIRFLPDQATEANLSSRSVLNQASFIWAEDLKREKAEDRPEGTSGSGSTDSGNNGNGSGSVTPSGNGNSGSQSGQSGDSNTLAAPTISGDTTFSESAEVSISAADGAEIRYTLDGSTPTAESTLYSEAFTVTETTSVKAIAIKDGQTSEVASKTFVKSSGEGGMDQN